MATGEPKSNLCEIYHFYAKVMLHLLISRNCSYLKLVPFADNWLKRGCKKIPKGKLLLSAPVLFVLPGAIPGQGVSPCGTPPSHVDSRPYTCAKLVFHCSRDKRSSLLDFESAKFDRDS